MSAQQPESSSQQTDMPGDPGQQTEASSQPPDDPGQQRDNPGEELQVLGALWRTAMHAPDLPPEVERRVAKFKQFQKPPVASLEIMRSALDADEDLRQSLLEKLEEDDSELLKALMNSLEAQGKDLAKAAQSADGPRSSAQELLAVHYDTLLRLWLLRPEGWRADLDRLLMLLNELRLQEAVIARQKNEMERLKHSPKKDQTKQDKTRKKAEQAKSQLHKEQTEKQRLEKQLKQQAEELEAAQEQMRHYRAEAQDVAGLRRQCNKLQKELSARQQRISKLEKEIRKLKAIPDPEETEPPAPRRTGYKREDHALVDPAQLEPRQPIVLPMGINSLSETAAHHYMRQAAVVIVDGYNFIFCGWQQETEGLTYKGKSKRQYQPNPNASKGPGLEVYRNRLIDNCARVFAAHKRYQLEHFSIIFDSSFPNLAMSAPPASGVDVLFTQRTTDADSEIVDRIRQYPNNKSLVVVTDDMELRIRCKALGATIMSVTQLLRIFGPTHQ